MSKAKQILEKMAQVAESMAPFEAATVKAAWTAKLNEFPEYQGVIVEDAMIQEDGSCVVSFADGDGDTVDVAFVVDEGGEPQAIAISDDNETEVDLTPLQPGILESEFFPYVNMTDLGWVNKSTLSALLGAASVGPAVEESDLIQEDPEAGLSEAVGASAAQKKMPIVRSSTATGGGAIQGWYPVKRKPRIGTILRAADGTIKKVVGYEKGLKGTPENPMVVNGKQVPGKFIKPIWQDIRKVKRVKRHKVISAAALAKSARTKVKNQRVKDRLMAGQKQAAASAAA